jgi:hypothetical protein
MPKRNQRARQEGLLTEELLCRNHAGVGKQLPLMFESTDQPPDADWAEATSLATNRVREHILGREIYLSTRFGLGFVRDILSALDAVDDRLRLVGEEIKRP